MRVVLAGGGAAGHIEPALALADALRQADGSIEVTCLGTQRGLETRLVPLRGYELELIPAVPLPRSVTPQLLTVPGRLAGAGPAVGTTLGRAGWGRTSSSASAGTWRRPRTWRPSGTRCRSWCTRRTRCPASPTGSARISPRHSS